MIPPEVFRQADRVRLMSRRPGALGHGEHRRDARPGVGLTLAGVTPYHADDDAKAIDWNATARAGTPYSKRYHRESELTVVVVVDDNPRMHFGTRDTTKAHAAAGLAAVVALAAAAHGHHVRFARGPGQLTDRAQGVTAVLPEVRRLFAPTPPATTSLDRRLEACGRQLRSPAILAVVSDYQAPPERPLRRLAGTHNVIAVQVRDPVEVTLPKSGMTRLADIESGTETLIDLGDPAVQEAVRDRRHRRDRAWRRFAAQAGIELVASVTHEDYYAPLAVALARRLRP